MTDNSVNLRCADRNKGKVIQYFPETRIEITTFEHNKVVHSAAKLHENSNNG